MDWNDLEEDVELIEVRMRAQIPLMRTLGRLSAIVAILGAVLAVKSSGLAQTGWLVMAFGWVYASYGWHLGAKVLRESLDEKP